MALTGLRKTNFRKTLSGDEMNKNLVVLIAVLITATFVYFLANGDKTQTKVQAVQKEAALPDALMVEGAPIDPMCFVMLGGETPTALTLKECGSNYEITDAQNAVDENGYVYAQYTTPGEVQNVRPSMIRYKYLGETKKGYNLLIESSGGGTGQFSSIYIVDRKEGGLGVVDVIAGGDRCNGGIESATVYEGELVFNQNVTPFDFLDLADSNPYGLKAYEDLDACAVCCYGVARYNADGFKGISVTAELDDLEDRDPSPERGMQNCFDKVLKSRMDIGQIDMPASVVKSFVQEFHAACTVE